MTPPAFAQVFTAQGCQAEQVSGAEIGPLLHPLGESWPQGCVLQRKGVPFANSHQGTSWALPTHTWLPALTQTMSFRRSGAPGLSAVGAVAVASRGLSTAATPALPPSPAPATCPRPGEMSPSACRGSGLHCLSLVQGGLGRGEPGSSQTWWSCPVPGGCGHHKPSEGWRPLGAQTCPVAPPGWSPLFPKVPRTRTPWASTVRGGSPWRCYGHAPPRSVWGASPVLWGSGGEPLSEGWNLTALAGIVPPGCRAHLSAGRLASPARGP